MPSPMSPVPYKWFYLWWVTWPLGTELPGHSVCLLSNLNACLRGLPPHLPGMPASVLGKPLLSRSLTVLMATPLSFQPPQPWGLHAFLLMPWGQPPPCIVTSFFFFWYPALSTAPRLTANCYKLFLKLPSIMLFTHAFRRTLCHVECWRRNWQDARPFQRLWTRGQVPCLSAWVNPPRTRWAQSGHSVSIHSFIYQMFMERLLRARQAEWGVSKTGQETIHAQGLHRSWDAGSVSACPPRLFHKGSGRQLRVEVGGQASGGPGKWWWKSQSARREADESSGRATPSCLQTQKRHTRAAAVSGTPFSTAGRWPPWEAELFKTRLSGRQVAGPCVRGPERVVHDQRPSWRGERPRLAAQAPEPGFQLQACGLPVVQLCASPWFFPGLSYIIGFMGFPITLGLVWGLREHARRACPASFPERRW